MVVTKIRMVFGDVGLGEETILGCGVVKICDVRRRLASKLLDEFKYEPDFSKSVGTKASVNCLNVANVVNVFLKSSE